eukprot:TRINITY_DN66738_c0_g1_i1.p1 TRINITY_DN66738_c0_g1~~TRINITY_DN66738_c0_g1_i1.p1  ORF type:complete len:363 (-),score=65.11 TRINITY_DN66738_c0_g1_i1:185-1273(-)
MNFDRQGRLLRLVDHLPDHKDQEVSAWAFEEEDLEHPVLLPPRVALPAASLRLKLGQIGDGLVLADDEVATSVPSSGTTTPKLVNDGSMPRILSLGSCLHGTGRCKPCSWFWKRQGCGNGFECTHCHLCPEDELKNRKKAKGQAKKLGLEEGPMATPEPGAEVSTGGENATQPGTSQEQFVSQQGTDNGISVCRLPPAPPAPAKQPAMLLCMYPPPSPSSASRTEVDALPLRQFEPKTMTEFESAHCRNCGDVLCTCPQDVIGFRCNHPDRMLRPLGAQPQELRRRAELYSLPSSGSAGHFDGTCSPCAWYWKQQGCANGKLCGRCHLCPSEELKKRKKVKQRFGKTSETTTEITEVIKSSR